MNKSNEMTRNSAFEIMRLLAMSMVILGHCVLSTAQNVEPYLGTIDMIGWGIGAFCGCAVNLFFILTGYFMDSQKFKLSRILSLWLKTIFYSVVIYVVLSSFAGLFNLKEAIGFFVPILTKKYWFMQTYIVVALMMPAIAGGVGKLTDRQLSFLVIVLLVFFSVHQTFFKVAYTLDQSQGYGVIWAIVMLVIGYWLKRNTSRVNKVPSIVYLIGYVVLSGMIVLTNYLIVRYNIAGGVVSRGNFYAYNSVSVFLQSVCMFCFFIGISERRTSFPIVNYLSKSVLAGYLISAHPLLLYPLWQDFLNMSQYTNSIFVYVLIAVFYSLLIMVGCIFVDKLVEQGMIVLGVYKIITKMDIFYEKYIGVDK